MFLKGTSSVSHTFHLNHVVVASFCQSLPKSNSFDSHLLVLIVKWNEICVSFYPEMTSLWYQLCIFTDVIPGEKGIKFVFQCCYGVWSFIEGNSCIKVYVLQIMMFSAHKAPLKSRTYIANFTTKIVFSEFLD